MVEEEGDTGTKVQVIAEPVISALQGVGQEVQGELVNEMAGAVADQLVQQYISALEEQGSVVTGTGVKSIQSRQEGQGEYGVIMADYLEEVDKGTTPSERLPIENYERFRAAAEEYGIGVLGLEKVIKEKGTDANAFKQEAREQAVQDARDRIADKLESALEENISG